MQRRLISRLCAVPNLVLFTSFTQVACSELLPVLQDLCIDKFGAVRKAVPSENPRYADRWKINKSAQYTKGIPKALGKATHICTSCGYATYLI